MISAPHVNLPVETTQVLVPVIGNIVGEVEVQDNENVLFTGGLPGTVFDGFSDFQVRLDHCDDDCDSSGGGEPLIGITMSFLTNDCSSIEFGDGSLFPDPSNLDPDLTGPRFNPCEVPKAVESPFKPGSGLLKPGAKGGGVITLPSTDPCDDVD